MNQRDEPTHELISAFLDGELSADERARVEKLLSSSVEHRQAFEEIRALSCDMQELPPYLLGKEFADDVLVAARQADPSLAKPAFSARIANRGPLAVRWRVAVAATVAAAAALSLAVFLNWPPAGSEGSGAGLLVSVDPDSRGENQKNATVKSVPSRPDTKVQPGETESVQPSASVDQVGSNGHRQRVPPASATNDKQPKTVSPKTVSPKTPKTVSPKTVSPKTPKTVPPKTVPPKTVPPKTVPNPRIAVGPGHSSQKVSLVIDVQVTSAGWEVGAFEGLLREEGVGFDASIRAESALEKALLNSRFFEPLDGGGSPNERPATPKTPFTVVYVVSRGGAIDTVWRRMKRKPEHFARVSLDMALQPGDTTIFGKLEQLGHVAQLQDSGSNEGRHSVAHRLELSESWNGMPAGPAGGGLAERMANMSSDPSTDPGADRPPTAVIPSAPGKLFGGGIQAQAIFVLRGQK